MRKAWRIALLTGMLLGFLGMGPKTVGSEELQSYSQSAWNYLKTLTGFGPRNFGSPGYFRTIDLIRKVGEEYADGVDVQTFPVHQGNGKTLQMSNIRLKFNGTRKGPAVLIGAHFDTRPYADEESNPALRLRPILGANDGGSGTAVVLTLARYLKNNRDRRPVELVFFDGEDYGAKGSGENLLGSTYYANQLRQTGVDMWPYCVIIIDMVGDRNLEIYKETHSMKSAPWLVELIYGTAEKIKVAQFHSQSKHTIFDDHYPFIGLGIPSVVLIDFDYPHWHTLEDTLDKCSKESLFAVFSVVAQAMEEI
ncbi:MAG: M28 family peptidase [Nitrospinae bacterium]|nr:M28 family peptidase [Nitrospinota bacterium]